MALATATSMVVHELMTQVQQSAVLLEALLRSASPPPPGEHQKLAAEILRCCDRVLASLRGGGGGGKKRKIEHGSSCTSLLPIKSKRRASCAEALRMVKSSAMEDGFIWRKYGQKEIYGHKYPRLYYRCTYRERGCDATRRVQKSLDDPSVYVITYFGEHTCRDGAVGEQAPQPVVIDFGSCTPLSSLVQHDGRCRNGEVGGGEISPSGEEYLEVQMGKVAGVEEPTPCDASLVGFLDWESTIESFDFTDLSDFDFGEYVL